MSKNYQKILSHPDREEIISKLIIGIPNQDIHDWLGAKYSTPAESQFVLSVNMLKTFQGTYLNFYQDMMQDLGKVKNKVEDADFAALIKGNPSYHDALVKVANTELDIETVMAKMATNVELRVSQVFDAIQADPSNINTKVDRLLIDYVEVLGNLLDKYYKWKEKPADQTIQHNINIQIVDQQIGILHDAIKEVLSQMDLEASMYFMEIVHEKMSKLKMADPEAAPTQEMKLVEAKLLNETINNKVNL